MIFKAVIIDDESKAVERMARIAKKNPYIECVGTFTVSQDALTFIKENDVDLIFLDIEMPQMSGLELAELIFDEKPEIDIVFVTAYDKYALEAFQVHAIGYLLKPIEEEDVETQMIRLLKKRKGAMSTTPSKSLQVNCFGGFQCYMTGQQEQLKWRTSKAEELFALLIHYRGTPISKEKIIDFLYEEMTYERASTNLHAISYYVRDYLKRLGIEQIFVRQQGMYSLSLSHIQCDYLKYMESMDQWSIPQAPYQTLEVLSQFNKGQYFEGKDYRWSMDMARWLEERFEEIDLRRGDLLIEVGQNEEASRILQGLIHRNGVLEEAYLKLIRLYKASGNEHLAKKWYMTYEKNLLTEIGENPMYAYQDI